MKTYTIDVRYLDPNYEPDEKKRLERDLKDAFKAIDEGTHDRTSMSLVHDKTHGMVILAFSTPPRWVALTAEKAELLAADLLETVKKIRRGYE